VVISECAPAASFVTRFPVTEALTTVAFAFDASDSQASCLFGMTPTQCPSAQFPIGVYLEVNSTACLEDKAAPAVATTATDGRAGRVEAFVLVGMAVLVVVSVVALLVWRQRRNQLSHAEALERLPLYTYSGTASTTSKDISVVQ